MTATNNRPVRAGIRGDGLPKLRHALANLQPFTTSGALRGESRNPNGWLPGPGLLNRDERTRMEEDHDASGIVYVVWSYATPIGWVRADGEVYIVRQRFSVTTGRHRGFLYLLNRPELAW